MKTIARILAGALATFFALIIASPVASACDCVPLTLQEQVDTADVVARVVVEDSKVVDREDGGQQVILTVRPVRVWKGDVVSKFTLTTAVDVAECGLGPIAKDTDLLLLANESEEKYTASWCGGTTDADESSVAKLVGIAGPGKDIDPVMGDEPGAFVWPTITGIVALLIVAGAVAYWWILPRYRR